MAVNVPKKPWLVASCKCCGVNAEATGVAALRSFGWSFATRTRADGRRTADWQCPQCVTLLRGYIAA
jgi:hypothetical protein